MKQWFADITFLFVFSVVVIVRGLMHIIWAVAILPAGPSRAHWIASVLVGC